MRRMHWVTIAVAMDAPVRQRAHGARRLVASDENN
jgi:hypothetical protein